MKRVFFTILLSTVISIAWSQQPAWTYKTDGAIVTSAVSANGLVYVGSEDSCLYALDQQSGKLVWKCKTSAPIRSDAALGDKLVYCYSSNGLLLALDKAKGNLVWSYTFTPEKKEDIWDYYTSSPVYYNGVVYIGNSDGKIYAFNAVNGHFKWDYTSDGPVHGAIAIDSNRLYAGNFAGVLFALNAGNGRLLWKFKTVGDAYFPKGEIQKGAVAYKGTVYFGSRDYNIYALDGAKGTGKWNWKEMGSWIIATPLVYQDNLYFGTSDSHAFYCVGKDYGQVKWKLALNMRVYGSAVAKDSLIYFGCFNGKLYGVNYRTGEIAWQFQTEGSKLNYATVYDESDHFNKAYEALDYTKKEEKILQLGSILGTPLINNNTIYFGSTDHVFYAVPLQ